MERQTKQPKFAICVRTLPETDLELHKVYQVLPDESAAKDGYLRVIDTSGEDYLYPRNLFVTFALPVTAQRTLMDSISSLSANRG